MSLPKLGTARTEKLGVSTVSEVVFRTRAEGGLAFVYRNQPEVGVGVDGHIEIVDQATDELTGKLFGVQIKAGSSFFRSRATGGWVVYIGKPTVHYWRQYAVPEGHALRATAIDREWPPSLPAVARISAQQSMPLGRGASAHARHGASAALANRYARSEVVAV
jgi:hypothetical protein